MSIQTQALADFLLARLTEDEQVVSAAFHAVGTQGRIEVRLACWSRDEAQWVVAPESQTAPSLRRLSAEVEAKRRLIDWSAPVSGTERVPTDRPGVYDRREVRYVTEDGEDVLRYLALPYADHPDYRQEWRP